MAENDSFRCVLQMIHVSWSRKQGKILKEFSRYLPTGNISGASQQNITAAFSPQQLKELELKLKNASRLLVGVQSDSPGALRSHTDVKRRHLHSYFKAEIFTEAAALEELDVEDETDVFPNHFVMSEEPFYLRFFFFYI